MLRRKVMTKEEFKDDSKRLNSLIVELELCQKEKDQILSEIELLESNNMLSQRQEELRGRMAKNLARFEEVVDKIKSIQK